MNITKIEVPNPSEEVWKIVYEDSSSLVVRRKDWMAEDDERETKFVSLLKIPTDDGYKIVNHNKVITKSGEEYEYTTMRTEYFGITDKYYQIELGSADDPSREFSDKETFVSSLQDELWDEFRHGKEHHNTYHTVDKEAKDMLNKIINSNKLV